MKLSILSALAVPALVAAHGNNAARHLDARQGAAASASSSSSHAASAASSAAVSVTSAATATPPPTVSFSLASTNPTAVPLSQIVSGASSSPTLGATTTYVAGAQATFLTGNPALPDISQLNPANYPALDKPPPTNSPQVQTWIQQVANSGITIPNIAPTVAGGCAANAAAAADTTRCWWTCGGCTRSTDVTTCPDKLTWGLTHDDGPAFYTPNLLQYLDQVNLKTTFFVVGSRAISYPAILREEFMSQHQIAVHTWSHPLMTTFTNEEIIAELGWTKKIIKDVTGVTPQYWRPPYGDIDDRVRAIGQAMDLTPVLWTRLSPGATFDTGDFSISGGTISASQVLANWQQIMGNVTQIDTGFIVLEHDLFQQSVEIATGYILPAALAFQPKLTIEPVVNCLHKPLSDAYVETNDNSTNPPAASGSNPTLSSGAPGSAEPTGAASPKKSAALGKAAVSDMFALYAAGFVAVAAGLAAAF
jgi:peptidoglycan/xylan/chitin deacetylase (PgdA/CDA1 family)